MRTVSESKNKFNYTFFLPFEKDYEENDVVGWIRGAIPLIWLCSGIYMVMVFGFQRYMKNREPFDLRRALALWSGFLAIFSIIGAARLVPERLDVVQKYGWTYSVCIAGNYTGPVGFWYLLFVVSKLYELGDTVFILLRKQKLVFLHWYHHVTVLNLAWNTLAGQQEVGRWYGAMNFLVHAFMYSYYTLKALKIRVPKAVAMSITVLQISQMIARVILVTFAFILKTNGRYCDTTFNHLYVAFGIYDSYLILFTHFFYKSYFKAGKAPVNTPKKKE